MDIARTDGGWRRLIELCRWPVVLRTNNPADLRYRAKACAHQETYGAQIVELSGALDASKGTRARLLHLVIVEQTLLKNVNGGLNAIPAEVLSLAVPQLASLPGFGSSPDLQNLFQRMLQIVEASGQMSLQCATTLGNKTLATSKPAERQVTPLEPRSGSEHERQQPSSRPNTEPVGNVTDSDDDFPDTKAFEDDQEILLPLPVSKPILPMNRAVAAQLVGRRR